MSAGVMFRKLVAISAVLLSTALSLSASTVHFATRQDIPTGAQNLTGLATADFNGDGKLDLAVTDDTTRQISVYLNDGTGKFGKPVITNVLDFGYVGLGYMVSGDVNEDGKQDLIVAPIAGLQYDIVLLGNGDGTFRQGQILQNTYGFLHASLLDINGDKHLDLVSAGNPILDVELGDGTGHFTQKQIPPAFRPSLLNTGFVVADFNGDGYADFISNSLNSLQLQFWKNNGDGSFAPPFTFTTGTVESGTNNLAAADFNGDGKLDLLTGTNYLGVLNFGNGDGSFQSGNYISVILPLPYAPFIAGQANLPILVAPADMDANGTIDVAAADDTTHLVSVLLNDGTGQFPQANADFSAALDPGTSSISTADLNGDGLPDIILTNSTTQNVSIFLSAYPKTSPGVTVQSSAAKTLVGGSVTITVQVKGTGAKVPTGTVSLASGTTSYGQQTLNSNGAATFILANLAAGQYALTASYAGDTYNNAVVSQTSFTQSITDFQVTLPTTTQTVAAGANATYAVNLTPVAGFNGSIALTCSGLPTGYVCTSTGTNLNGQAATASILVSPPASVQLKFPSWPGVARSVSWCLLLGLLLPWRRRSFAKYRFVAILFLSVGTITGCGGSGISKPARYTGTSSFIITATTIAGSQSVAHQITATLVVH